MYRCWLPSKSRQNFLMQKFEKTNYTPSYSIHVYVKHTFTTHVHVYGHLSFSSAFHIHFYLVFCTFFFCFFFFVFCAWAISDHLSLDEHNGNTVWNKVTFYKHLYCLLSEFLAYQLPEAQNYTFNKHSTCAFMSTHMGW